MSGQSENFEDFFRHSFEEFTEKPSEKVLRDLKRKLRVSDFFSLRMRKLNIVYVLLVFTGVGAALFMNNFNSRQTGNVNSSDLNDKPLVQDENIIVSGEDKNTLSEQNESGVLINKTLAAFFEVSELKGCAPLKMSFKNKSVSTEDAQFRWDFGTGDISKVKNPEYTFKKPGKYDVILILKTNDKEYSYSQTVEVFEKPKADFEIDVRNSEIDERKVLFRNKSTQSSSYRWIFGDSNISGEKDASHIYSAYKIYPVTLIASSENGCTDTITLKNKFLAEEYKLIFPVTFRPNVLESNNGYYESASNHQFVFYPENNGVSSYELKIVAPNGAEVFTSKDIKVGWNGYIRGKLAPAGTYIYMAKGIYPNGKSFEIKSKVKVIVDDYQLNY